LRKTLLVYGIFGWDFYIISMGIWIPAKTLYSFSVYSSSSLTNTQYGSFGLYLF